MRKKCSIENCDKPNVAKTFCTKHYRRFKLNGDPNKCLSIFGVGSTQEEMFWSKVDRNGNCWKWLGIASPDGYGKCFFKVNGQPFYLAHRLAFYFATGIEAGRLKVCHRCDNPICCNPEHLFLGTDQDNTNDRVAKNRIPRGENSPGAKLKEREVLEIRRIYESENITMKKLARSFGVCDTTIKQILSRHSWKHI